MDASRFAPIYSSLSMAVLAGPSALLAQEIVEVPGRDQRIDPDFEEVYRVGVLEGESWEMFGQVGRVAFDAEGNLYVFDGTSGPSDFGGVSLMRSGDVRVLVFDGAGRFVREFGSSGQGPGEFNQPMGFAVLRDGTVVVSDFGHRAYQLFDAGGAFQRMVRADGGPDAVAIPARDIQPDPRGGAVFAGGSAASITMGAGRGRRGRSAHLPSGTSGWARRRGPCAPTRWRRDGCRREPTSKISRRGRRRPSFAPRFAAWPCPPCSSPGYSSAFFPMAASFTRTRRRTR